MIETINGRAAGSAVALPAALQVMDGMVRGGVGATLRGGHSDPLGVANVLLDHAAQVVAMIEAPHVRRQVCENVAERLSGMVEERHAALVRAAGMTA